MRARCGRPEEGRGSSDDIEERQRRCGMRDRRADGAAFRGLRQPGGRGESGVRRRARLARRTPYGPRAPHGSFVSAPLARNGNPRPAGFGSTADPSASCNVLEFCALALRNCFENAMSSSFALSLEGLEGLRRMQPKADPRFRPRALSCPGAGRAFLPAQGCKTQGHCKKEAFAQSDGGIGGDAADGIRAMASACRFGRRLRRMLGSARTPALRCPNAGAPSPFWARCLRRRENKDGGDGAHGAVASVEEPRTVFALGLGPGSVVQVHHVAIGAAFDVLQRHWIVTVVPCAFGMAAAAQAEALGIGQIART